MSIIESANNRTLESLDRILSFYPEGTQLPTHMQLHKLVFNTNGWNLAIYNTPITSEVAQASDSGPFFSSIWNYFERENFSLKAVRARIKVDHQSNFTSEESDLVWAVWNKYKSFDPLDLAKMTQAVNSPWYTAYFTRGRHSGISEQETKEYFTKLAIAGRENMDTTIKLELA